MIRNEGSIADKYLEQENVVVYFNQSICISEKS